MIHEFRNEDAAAAAALKRRIEPFAPVTEASVVHGICNQPAQAQRRAWVADGGYATAGLLWQAKVAGLGMLWIGVDPDRRRRGLGAALLRAALEHLRGIGLRKVESWCTPEGAAFLEHRGWERTRERIASAVELTARPALEPPEGVELAPLRDVDPRWLYELDLAAAPDEPGETIEFSSFEDYERGELARPLLDHDLSVVAVADGKAVALSLLFRDGAVGQNGFTCTHPDWRGRGLAKLVKSASLRRAFADGVERVSTTNDAENAAILHVNEWLGYRPYATEAQLVLSGSALADAST